MKNKKVEELSRNLSMVRKERDDLQKVIDKYHWLIGKGNLEELSKYRVQISHESSLTEDCSVYNQLVLRYNDKIIELLSMEVKNAD